MTGLPTELLAAAVASPEDDAPRLACADWLEEHGRPEDAHFVRVQLRLAGREKLTRAEHGRLVAESRALGEAHAERWLAEFEAGGWAARHAHWHRGFLERVTLAHAGASGPDALAPVSAYPLLGGLTVEGPPWLPAAALLRLPPLPCLRQLDLGLDAPPDEAVRARLADFPALSQPFVRYANDSAYLDTFDSRLNELRRERQVSGPPGERAARLEAVGASFKRSRGGRLAASLHRAVPDFVHPDALGALPGLACVILHTRELPAWLSRRTDLVSLAVSDLREFHPEQVASRDLRQVGLVFHEPAEGAWERALAWLETLPRLGTLVMG